MRISAENPIDKTVDLSNASAWHFVQTANPDDSRQVVDFSPMVSVGEKKQHNNSKVLL